jgi:hypothetical protein
MANYLGIPIFPMGEAASFIDMGDDAFRLLSPIQNMLGHESLGNLVKPENKNLSSFLIGSCATGCLATSHGINRAYNSQKYKGNLTGVAQQILSKATSHRGNELIALNADGVPTDDYTTWFTEVDGILGGYDPDGYVQQAKEKSVQVVSQEYERLKALIETLGDKATATMKWAFWEIKKVYSALTSSSTEGSIKGVPAVIPITVGGVAESIAAITSLVINFLSATSLGGMIEAIKWTITSIVAKYLGGTLVAEGCRYLAAAALHAIAQSLPSIFAITGMFGGAFAALMAYAPVIIVGAIITILIIKRHKRIIGEELYLIGMVGDKVRAYSNLKLYDTELFEEMEAALKDTYQEIMEMTSIGFDSFWGFALNDDKEGALAIDFLGNKYYNVPDEVDEKVNPYRSIIYPASNIPFWLQ